MHKRRERTFLVLAMLFVVGTVAPVLVGPGRMIDVAYAISSIVPGLGFAIAPELPFGVLLLPVAFVAACLACELFGRSRANGLVVVGFVAVLGLAGLMHLADRVDEGGLSLAFTVAFLASYLVAQLANVVLFDVLRYRMRGRHAWIRMLASTILAQLVGWSVFAAVRYLYASQLEGVASLDAIVAVAIGSALYSVAFVFAALIPFVALAPVLRTYLRVADLETDDELDDVRSTSSNAWESSPRIVRQRPTKPPAVLVADEPPLKLTQRKRPGRTSAQPFTSSEMRFFTEGELLAEPEAADPS